MPEPDRIIGYQKSNTKSYYHVRWKSSFLTAGQLCHLPLNRIFKVREAHRQSKFFRITRRFQPTERFYIVMWKDTWVGDADVFAYGSLLHGFWGKFYAGTTK